MYSHVILYLRMGGGGWRRRRCREDDEAAAAVLTVASFEQKTEKRVRKKINHLHVYVSIYRKDLTHDSFCFSSSGTGGGGVGELGKGPTKF